MGALYRNSALYRSSMTWRGITGGGGDATFTTVVGASTGAGNSGSMSGTISATFTSLVSSATAEGNSGSMSGNGSATFATLVGDAPAVGNSGTMSGTANVTFTTVVGDAPAAGGSGSLVGTVNITFTTVAGDATAAGNTGAMQVPEQSATYSARFTTFPGWAYGNGDATSFNTTAPSFASVRASQTTVIDSNSTSHTVTLPSQVLSSDLILLVCSHDGTGGTVSPPSGFSTVLANTNHTSGDNGLAIFAKIAVGTEASTTVTWTTTASEASSTIAVSIGSWGGVLADIQVATPVSGSTNPIDPPSLTSALGSANWLWIAVAGWDSNRTITGTPTSYTGQIAALSGANGGAGAVLATRQLTAATENPSASWSLSTAETTVSVTLAITTGAGNARFATATNSVPAVGDLGALSGTAAFTTVGSTAPAVGGTTIFHNLSEFNTLAGSSTGSGGSTSYWASSSFTTNAGNAPAAGNLATTWYAERSETWVTEGGSATADGNEGVMVIPVHVTFDSTSIGEASAAGNYQDYLYVTDSAITSVVGAATAATTGTSILSGTALFSVTGTSSATASGGVGSLKSDRYTWVTTVGSATAAGRSSAMHTAALPLEVGQATAFTNADLMLTPDHFQAFLPSIVPNRTATFTVEPWRVVAGIPESNSWYSADEIVSASIGASAVSDAFVAPTSLADFSQFRWLSSAYSTPEWIPVNAGSPTAGDRSWDEVRNSFSWSTARLRTWTQLKTTSADATVPLWQNYGSINAASSATYTYWRVSEYVTNPAVLVSPGAALELVWSPTTTYNQLTVAVTFVPRVPTSGSYEILSATSDLRVVLNSDSTMDLISGSDVISTATVGARTRPNEPIVVALSVVPSAPGTNTWRAYMVVMDTMVRTTAMDIHGSVSQADLDWRIASGKTSTFEILEIDMYTNPMTSDRLSSEMNVYDRMYGVTVV